MLLVTLLPWDVEAKTLLAVIGAQLLILLPPGQTAEASPFTDTGVVPVWAVMAGGLTNDGGVDWTGEESTLLIAAGVGLFVGGTDGGNLLLAVTAGTL